METVDQYNYMDLPQVASILLLVRYEGVKMYYKALRKALITSG
jgi:hypothetical protein